MNSRGFKPQNRQKKIQKQICLKLHSHQLSYQTFFSVLFLPRNTARDFLPFFLLPLQSPRSRPGPGEIKKVKNPNITNEDSKMDPQRFKVQILGFDHPANVQNISERFLSIFFNWRFSVFIGHRDEPKRIENSDDRQESLLFEFNWRKILKPFWQVWAY